MSLAFITYMPFVAAQFYPRSYTLIPTGVAIGIGASALWCSKATYLTVVAEAFSVLTKNSAKSKVFVVRFFGIFYFFFQTAQVWGNLISSSGVNRLEILSWNLFLIEYCFSFVSQCPGDKDIHHQFDKHLPHLWSKLLSRSDSV